MPDEREEKLMSRRWWMTEYGNAACPTDPDEPHPYVEMVPRSRLETVEAERDDAVRRVLRLREMSAAATHSRQELRERLSKAKDVLKGIAAMAHNYYHGPRTNLEFRDALREIERRVLSELGEETDG